MPYERACASLRESLFLEIITDMREELTSFGHLCHEAVEVVGLHGLIEPYDIGMTKPPHQLSLSQEILPNVILLDLVRFYDFDCYLHVGGEYNKSILMVDCCIKIKHTFPLVRVCTADSTLAKFPFPRVNPVSTYLPMHLTCFEEPDPLLPPLCTDGGRGGGCWPASSLPRLFVPWVILIRSLRFFTFSQLG